MHKTVSQILSIMLLASFLVSFTGIRLVVHECDTCGTVETSLFGNPDKDQCCASGSSDGESCAIPIAANSHSESCCLPDEPVNASSANCCSSESFYLIADLDFIKDNLKHKVDAQLAATFVSLFCLQDLIITDQSNPSPFYKDFSPPLRSGRDFLIFSHQLKIS